jgi:hypothetical protein
MLKWGVRWSRALPAPLIGLNAFSEEMLAPANI